MTQALTARTGDSMRAYMCLTLQTLEMARQGLL